MLAALPLSELSVLVHLLEPPFANSTTPVPVLALPAAPSPSLPSATTTAPAWPYTVASAEANASCRSANGIFLLTDMLTSVIGTAPSHLPLAWIERNGRNCLDGNTKIMRYKSKE